MNTTLTIVIPAAALLLAALAVATWCILENKAMRVAISDAEVDRDHHQREVEHLRTIHARKIDRALWLLVQVRLDRSSIATAKSVSKVAGPPPRSPIDIQVTLSGHLAEALERDATSKASECCELTHLTASHIARRIAKEATQS